jgi:dimethylaniline monooxygenase (N-oxide forming)
LPSTDIAGAAGLTATKNLVEQGFDVTAFDRNDEVGGLWTFKDDPTQTTVLRSMFISSYLKLKLTRSHADERVEANGTVPSGACKLHVKLMRQAPYHDFPFPDGEHSCRIQGPGRRS